MLTKNTARVCQKKRKILGEIRSAATAVAAAIWGNEKTSGMDYYMIALRVQERKERKKKSADTCIREQERENGQVFLYCIIKGKHLHQTPSFGSRNFLLFKLQITQCIELALVETLVYYYVKNFVHVQRGAAHWN